MAHRSTWKNSRTRSSGVDGTWSRPPAGEKGAAEVSGRDLELERPSRCSADDPPHRS
jgi:hypothetical protein